MLSTEVRSAAHLGFRRGNVHSFGSMRPAMAAAPDVLVVGAGAIGGAIAVALAERGIAVTVLESGQVGRGATWASAGFLGPDWTAHDPPALTRLAEDSLALWPDFAHFLEDRTGIGLHFRRDGLLNLWLDPDARGLPLELATEPPAPGLGERLNAAEARKLEPLLTGPVLGAALHSQDAQVDNTRLGPALGRVATGLGARIHAGTPVAAITTAASRCTGVRLADGTSLPAGAVVLAAGAWSGLLAAGLGIRLPMEPWRGQMMAFDAAERPVSHIVICGELVLIPRPHGPLVVGTTLEHAGFDCRVTLGGLALILARAVCVVPGLSSLPLIRSWAGLRPGTPDYLPYLGRLGGIDGLYTATGHGRKGILLAPITGALMAQLIVDGTLDARLQPCAPDRVG
jgi:glycine oxidase